MAEKKLVEKIKENTVFKIGVGALEIVAKIGGAAAIGFLLKKQDYSGMPAIKKACLAAGIFGLGAAAGSIAGNAMRKEIEEDTEVICDIVDSVQGTVYVDEVDEAEVEATEA